MWSARLETEKKSSSVQSNTRTVAVAAAVDNESLRSLGFPQLSP